MILISLALMRNFLPVEIPDTYITVVGSLSLQLAILFTALFFLWQKDLKTTLKSIGFPGTLVNTVIFSILGFALLFSVLFALGLLSTILDFNDQEKITDKITSLPLVVLAFAVTIAPIGEELFFRALLLPRSDSFFLKLSKVPHLGILFSSAVFAASHFSYGSVVEIIGAFAIGIVLAVVYKASKSITPCILIHMIYNLASILAMNFILNS